MRRPKLLPHHVPSLRSRLLRTVSVVFKQERGEIAIKFIVATKGKVFELVFVYFFFSIGLVFILNTMIGGVSRSDKTRARCYRLAVSVALGLGLSLMAFVAVFDG